MWSPKTMLKPGWSRTWLRRVEAPTVPILVVAGNDAAVLVVTDDADGQAEVTAQVK